MESKMTTHEQFKVVRRYFNDSADIYSNMQHDYNTVIHQKSKKAVKLMYHTIVCHLIDRIGQQCQVLNPNISIDQAKINRLLGKYGVLKKIKKRKLKPLIKHSLFWLRFEIDLSINGAIVGWVTNNMQWLKENKTAVEESCNEVEKTTLQRTMLIVDLINSDAFGPREKSADPLDSKQI
jgi:hypothetical protein